MNIIYVQDNDIPELARKRLQGKSIEEQLKFFRLEQCYTETYFIDNREIKNPLSFQGTVQDITDEMALLVCDDIIVGIEIDGEKIYSFSSFPCSKVKSWDGHRTGSEGWYYDEKHRWYKFMYSVVYGM